LAHSIKQSAICSVSQQASPHWT